ncbi:MULTISPECIES: capsular polysaccharide synthesis protein [unclassified Acinetobacter]|uniref:capsular polysaccharide synthesis protein n=1 Tax=unclassified Acinetobacter TaxID=196816 RepID=UPI003AF8AD05
MNKVFAFWESKEKIPAYLELCKKTWEKNIPNLEIHILNHNNLEQYIGDIYNLDNLKKISYAMQSDIISTAVLEKFGGLFLDLDCIVTTNIIEKFNTISEDKLIGFGYPNKGMHLAVLYSKNKGNPILREWRKTAQERLSNMPNQYDWSYFGNGILNPLLQDNIYKDYQLIIDRTSSGNILESKAFLASTYANSKEYYMNFYFNPFFKIKVKEVYDLIEFGVVSLHNSWTPVEYKKIKSIDEFLNKNIPLVDLLKYVLNFEDKNNFDNSDFEKAILEKVGKIRYFLKSNYYKNKLVLDFKSENIQIGLDIYSDSSNANFNLDLVIRNSDFNKYINTLPFNEFSFNKNKAQVLTEANFDKIHEKILEIHNGLY